MKVKVRKLTFAQRVAERLAESSDERLAAERERDMIARRLTELRPEYAEERLEADAEWKRQEKQQALCDKYGREYYAIFPDDPPMCYALDVDSTPAFDQFIMTNMYVWAIEHRRHWYEWPDLPESYVPDFRFKWRNSQHESKH